MIVKSIICTESKIFNSTFQLKQKKNSTVQAEYFLINCRQMAPRYEPKKKNENTLMEKQKKTSALSLTNTCCVTNNGETLSNVQLNARNFHIN